VGPALVTEVVVAARSTHFMQAFSPLQVGRARALALTSRGVSAQPTEEWGFIRRCTDERLISEAMALAARLAAGPPPACAALTGTMDQTAACSFADQLNLKRDVQRQLVGSEDFAEAAAAFRDKRNPVFWGKLMAAAGSSAPRTSRAAAASSFRVR